MQETESTDTMDAEVPKGAGFPDRDSEFEAVMDINEQMMNARDEWEPPEEPTYTASNESKQSVRRGTIRALDRIKSAPRHNSPLVKVGVDTGEDSLEWFRIEDTGEASLSNPYVKLCKTYDANPENSQELYNKTVLISNKNDEILTRVQYPVLGQLWSFAAAHHKYGLFKLGEKKTMDGVLPTLRFFPLYMGAMVGTWALAASGSVLMAFLLIPLMFVLGWGIYAKLWYETLPYALKWLGHKHTLYQHGELF